MSEEITSTRYTSPYPLRERGFAYAFRLVVKLLLMTIAGMLRANRRPH